MLFAKPQPDPIKPRSKALILVVDDDIQMVVMMRSNLETEGYRVEFATDGITGKQKALGAEAGFNYFGYFHARVNGLAMMESINEASGIERPIIFLSGDAQENIIPPTSTLARRYALMKKPIFLPELNQLVRTFLS